MILIACVVVLLGFAAMRPADLRDKALKTSGITGQAELDGRVILEKMAAAHGSRSYHSKAQQTFRFKNTWQWLPGAMYRPWRENGQAIEMTCFTGASLKAETRFLSGVNKGEIWGVDQQRAYTRKNTRAAPIWQRDANIELWISSFQFLFELPFRTAYYPLVADMGMDQLDGQSYRKVFVTWNNAQASNAYDQLILWINPTTYLLEKAHYTCRDSGFGFFTATIHYRDYVKRNGFLAAQSADITFGGPQARYFGQYIELHRIEYLGTPAYTATDQ